MTVLCEGRCYVFLNLNGEIVLKEVLLKCFHIKYTCKTCNDCFHLQGQAALVNKTILGKLEIKH